MPDALPPCALPSSMPPWSQVSDLQLGAPSSLDDAAYTFDRARKTATYDNGGTEYGAIDSTNLTAVIVNGGGTEWHAPHLTPEGDEVFVREDAGGTSLFVAIPHDAPTHWGGARMINISGLGVVLDTSVTPGTPTHRAATPQRRMMIAIVGVFYELVEDDPANRSWSVKNTIEAMYFKTPTGDQADNLRQPQLSPDGLRMVFIARVNMTNSIYASTRTVLDAPWGPAIFVFEDGGSGTEHDPFLSGECLDVYFYSQSSAIVRHLHAN
jgi:hypothetical protein